jgi:hypothetical protein
MGCACNERRDAFSAIGGAVAQTVTRRGDPESRGLLVKTVKEKSKFIASSSARDVMNLLNRPGRRATGRL